MISKTERLTCSVKEAASMLGISKNLAYSLCKQGKMPGAIKLGPKRIIISLIKLKRILEGEQCDPLP